MIPNAPERSDAIRYEPKPLRSLALVAALLLLVAAALVPVVRNARSSAWSVLCIQNLKRSAVGMLMYAEENDGRLPAATEWMDRIDRYVPHDPDAGRSSFRCPAVGPGEYGYAMFQGLGHAPLASIRDAGREPMVFESADLSRNAHASQLRLPDPPRHPRPSVAHADGRVSAPDP